MRERHGGPTISQSYPFRLDRYDVLLPIASGGMATVYLARARGAGGFERDVALKLAHAHLCETPEAVADLIEEGKLTSRVRHPNAVGVLDVGEAEGRVFLVLDYVEGDTLASLIRRAPPPGLPPSIGLRILLDALAGLASAHDLRDAQGAPLDLVHRDVSPQNILVGLDGAGRISDFGVARATSRASHTATGMVKGKTAYMPPEQARGHAVDRRADVWAAGVIAWEILAGRRMYEDDNDVVLLLKLVSEPPPRLRSARPDIPEVIELAVAAAVEPDLLRRCRDVHTFARSLAHACSIARQPIAEPREVAAWVERLVGDRLRKRRAQADQIAVRAAAEQVPTIIEPLEELQTSDILPPTAAAPSTREPPAAQEPPPSVSVATAVTGQSTGTGLSAAMEAPLPVAGRGARYRPIAAVGGAALLALITGLGIKRWTGGGSAGGAADGPASSAVAGSNAMNGVPSSAFPAGAPWGGTPGSFPAESPSAAESAAPLGGVIAPPSPPVPSGAQSAGPPESPTARSSAAGAPVTSAASTPLNQTNQMPTTSPRPQGPVPVLAPNPYGPRKK